MTRAEERELNYSTILRAAIDCFLAEGIDKTSVNDIAQKSGLTPMSVYRYFGNKQAIAVAVANHLLREYLNEHTQRSASLRIENESGYDEFARIVRAYIDTYESHPEYIRFLQEMTAFSLREAISEQIDYMHFALPDSPLNKPAYQALQRGIEDGSVRKEIDLPRVSQTLTNLLTGGVNFKILIDDRTQMDILRHTAEMIIYYIKSTKEI